MKRDQYCIGVDFGTDSVRAILVDAANGAQLATSVFDYPRWKAGLYCDPARSQFRQHPLDHLEGLESTINDCLRQAGPAAAKAVRAISVDTTGSTPVAVDASGTPLSLLPAFEQNPNAMFVLWKDHTAVEEAAAINAHAATCKTNYLKFVGGIYSSEWFWAKLLHVLRTDSAVAKACFSWVEHCDFIPFLLTGGNNAAGLKRGVCAAGHKALWTKEFNGYPPDEFFSSLDPLLKGFANRLPPDTYTSDRPAGKLSPEWAQRLGLSTDVLIGIGAMDAHMGAVGAQISPYYLSKAMGTSTCDMLVAPVSDMAGKYVQGICGLVNGSVIPGMIGMEAGQSAFGDVYAWFRNLLAWPLKQMAAGSDAASNFSPDNISAIVDRIIPELSRQAATLSPNPGAELSLDWFNGRRTPDANQLLKGAITGLDLASDPVRLFRSLAEATCFGARSIAECFARQNVPVKGLIGFGGVAKRSPFIMQMMADVLDMPIKINRSEQTTALGAAMFAATVAGIYPQVEDAMQAMGQGFDAVYQPDKNKTQRYAQRYRRYVELGRYIESHSFTKAGAL